MLPIKFHNKGLDHIQLSSILHEAQVINTLPANLQLDDVPSIIYSLEDTIRNKIFNYKQTVNDIDIHDHTSFGTGITSCQCHQSAFTDQNHGNIVTGDLRFIDNSDFRRLLSKGPNYREPRSISWKKCRENILIGVDVCAGNMGDGHNGVDLTSWKEKIMERVDAKIISLKQKITPRMTNPILKRDHVQAYLDNLHKNFVLVPIDKAANNIAIICKKYYVEVIFKGTWRS